MSRRSSTTSKLLLVPQTLWVILWVMVSVYITILLFGLLSGMTCLMVLLCATLDNSSDLINTICLEYYNVILIFAYNELFVLNSGCEDISYRSFGSHVPVHGRSPAHVLWRWETSPPFTNRCWVWEGKYGLLKYSNSKWPFQRVDWTISGF